MLITVLAIWFALVILGVALCRVAARADAGATIPAESNPLDSDAAIRSLERMLARSGEPVKVDQTR